nr:substrate binding domain-containing protein [Stutzerimonas kunmingensis]
MQSTTGLGIQVLAGLAGRYGERYPEVSLDLTLSQHQPDLLEAGLDVIITLSRELPDSELIAQRLGEVGNVVCAAPGYLEQYGVPQQPRDLQQHRCLRLADPVFADEWRFIADGAEDVIRPGEAFKVNVAEAMASAAEAGMGICLLPRLCRGSGAAARRTAAPLAALSSAGKADPRSTRPGVFSTRRSRPGSTVSRWSCRAHSPTITASCRTRPIGPDRLLRGR